MPGSQPGPAGQLFRAGKPTDVPDFGDEDRSEGRTDPADLLDHLISTVPGEPVDDHRPEHHNFPVVGIDELQQRIDPLAVDQIQRRPPQPRHASLSEHIRALR
jgi:hypothetical protein